MCAGLAAAHERGVLHSDLKPANVMNDGTFSSPSSPSICLYGACGSRRALMAVSAIVFVMLRFGLLSMLTLFVVNFLLISSAPTLDPSKWFFSTSLMLLFLIVSVLGVYGFYA